MKIFSKIDRQALNDQYDVASMHQDTIKQEVHSVRDNKIVTRTIVDGDIEFTESVFDPKVIADVIVENINIQLSLYQFYVYYSGVENKEAHKKEKLVYELRYPNEGSKVSNELLSSLLSVFDSLNVVYKKNMMIIAAMLSDIDTKIKIYDLYKKLYEKSLLNPFIVAFTNEMKVGEMEIMGSAVFQYEPFLDDIDPIILNQKEIMFIDYIEQQLNLSDYFMFYCYGWNEDDVAASVLLKKLAKYFKRIFFTSKPDPFSSELLMIYAERK
ncbi:hypothetical protein PAEVO_40280 [Paenibacillus sp. GM2FR]|uniref:hypothetical protein n=1 Tax=Paenibacillus sp. GM2FR TaxID=2059268 RepID=UPI000C27CD64|nr:hypothetical protein [Paenibacillus sp. GM2FR]PJN57294.1 hypothetical protein PAEVO_40280 [Paenibacillus sp. GM2FR]